jgi:imidazolonepropionase-like amidohydrolase
VQLTDARLETARSAGFTTAVTFPRRGIVAGHGAVINLAGDSPGRMILHPSAALYLTLSSSGAFGSFPGSLMGTIAYLRQLWLDAEHYRTAKDLYARHPAGIPRPQYDRALEGVLEARRILLPATSRVEIERMIRFAAELKTPAVLYGLHQGYRAAAALKAAGLPVIVNVRWPETPRDADPETVESLRVLETRDQAPSTPAVLAAAGVPFAFSSDGLEAPRDLIRAVKKSIDAGLTREQAIRALTLGAAEIYGVADRLGTIDKGKIANLTVVKGDLFDERAPVQMVFIDGVKHMPAPPAPTPPGAPSGRPTGPSSTLEVMQ